MVRLTRFECSDRGTLQVNDHLSPGFPIRRAAPLTEQRLRFSFINLRDENAPPTAGSYDVNSLVKGKAKVLAQVFSDPFQVYSAKKFPGVCESTPLSKCFATQGVKIPIRKDAPDGGKNSKDESDGED